MTRDERRHRTSKVMRKRVTGYAHWGLDSKFKKHPHRLVKLKQKFTSPRGSMKEMKQAENRSFRHINKQKVNSGQEEIVKHKNSVRYNYW